MERGREREGGERQREKERVVNLNIEIPEIHALFISNSKVIMS